jgi:uncharacterized protein involved in exopolysaccharide biosynthesis
METTQNRLIALSQEISRDRDRLTALETAIASTPTVAEPVTSAPRPLPARAGANAPTAAQLLEAARTALAAIELRLKPAHPDLVDAKRKLAELEAKAEAEALQQPVSAPTETAPAASTTTGPSATAQNKNAAMQLEVTELRQRLESRKQQEAQLQKLLASYTARVEATPAVEAQLTELTRDYSTLQEQYTTLLRRNEESKLAANLERRQIGEQFRVIDGARLPERPFSPDRLHGTWTWPRPHRAVGVPRHHAENGRRRGDEPRVAGAGHYSRHELGG